MKTKKEDNNRREFFKKCGLLSVPFLLPTIGFGAVPLIETLNKKTKGSKAAVNFIYDGPIFSPEEYLEKLYEINSTKPIEPDYYGNGGATKSLEIEFAKITGKEKAIYLPSGTMANELAIKLLNGNNTKVIVPENSHIFRDEADAAQSVHELRLIPIGKDSPYFELNDLENAVSYLNNQEVFKSGLGTVAIENPVRRADGTAMPLATIKEISNYCRQHDYKLHLDGARIHIASAYTNVSISEYASYFDTVYISLYKYLNAAGGAILCGDAAFIDKIPHQIKIHGGTMFQTWTNTSMALHYLKGIEDRWKNVISSANSLIKELNKFDSTTITSLKNGTNIYDLEIGKGISLKEFTNYLYKEHNIFLGAANENGIIKFKVNESLLTRDNEDIIYAWKDGIDEAGK